MESLAQYRSRVGLFARVAGSTPKKKNVAGSTRNIKTDLKKRKGGRRKPLKMETEFPTLKVKYERTIQGRTSYRLILLVVVCCVKLFSNNSEISVCSSNFTHSLINKYNIDIDVFHFDLIGSRYFEHRLHHIFVNDDNDYQYTTNLANESVSSILDYNYTTNYMECDLNAVSNVYYETIILHSWVKRIKDEQSYFNYSVARFTTRNETNTRLACSQGTCCFLLGNKGTHCYNGNPHQRENDVGKILDDWKKEDRFYISTNYTKDIFDMVYATWCKCVIVTGDASVGKTTVMRNVSLVMNKQGCNVYVITDPEELLQHSPSEEWRIFIIDDIFGKTSLDMHKIKQWKKFEGEISSLLTSRTTMLTSLRMDFINDRNLKNQAFSFFEKEKRRVIPIGYEHYQLSKIDVKEILKYLSDLNKLDKAEQMIENVLRSLSKCRDLRMLAWFPFFCKIFFKEDSIRLHSTTFFIEPVPILQDFFSNLKNKDKVLFCGLVLCLESKGFDSNLDNTMTYAGTKNEDIASVFSIILPSRIEEISKSLDSVCCFYVSKIGSTFHISHILVRKIVYDIYVKHLHINGYEKPRFISSSAQTPLDIEWAFPPLVEKKPVSHSQITPGCLDSVDQFHYKWSKQQHHMMKGNSTENKKTMSSPARNAKTPYDNDSFKRDNVELYDISRSASAESSVKIENVDIAPLNNYYADIISSRSGPNALLPLSVVCWFGHFGLFNLLLDNNVDLNEVDSEGCTPLFIAVRTGNMYFVQCLLRNHANVNVFDRAGCSSLDYAIRYRRYDIARLLIFYRAYVNSSGKIPNILTPLYTACYKGYNELVDLLLQNGADANQTIQGKSYRVKSGIRKEVEIDIDRFEASSPLGLACNHGNIEIVKTLIDNGADVNIVDRNGLTPLEYSVNRKNMDIIEFLLYHNADIDRLGEGIWAKTVLGAACYDGDIKLVRMLIDHGADVNKLDGSGRTPLERSVDANEIDVINILLEKEANVDLRGNGPYASTPLCTACYKGYLSIVELLIEKKADVNKTDSYGSTPLQRAFDGNHLSIISLLFSYGAIIKDIEQFGSSLLCTACYEGNIDIVKYLLEHNVSVNLCDSEGQFPLERAVAGNHIEIYKLLRNNCAVIDGGRDTCET